HHTRAIAPRRPANGSRSRPAHELQPWAGMYTKARIAGHPIHPMLVAFPIALYVSTVVALLAHAGTHDPFWYRVALWTNLVGVVMAAVAAIPGLIDLLSIPARSRARATGLRHAGFNVLALVLFA